MHHTGRTGGLSCLRSSSSITEHGLLFREPCLIACPYGSVGAVGQDFLDDPQNNHTGHTTPVAFCPSIIFALPAGHSSALPGPHQQAMFVQDVPVSRFKTTHAVHLMMLPQPSDRAVTIRVRGRHILTRSPPRYDSKDRIRHTGYASNGRK